MTDANGLSDIHCLELSILEDGQIGGMNGVLLGIAGESKIPGICLLGEVPHVFIQFPFPKASLAVLEAFRTLAGIELDLTELAQQAKEVEEQLGDLLAQVERAIEERREAEAVEDDEEEVYEAPEVEQLDPTDRERLEHLFKQAAEDRSKAYELKSELDRLKVFEEYEDRFLDLFRPRK